MEIDTHPSPVSRGAERETALLKVVGELVQELHPQRAKVADVLRSSRLERDLGIDSLARTELILRIERAFGARLPSALIGDAEAVGDLLRALEQAHPQGAAGTGSLIAPVLPAVPPAAEARTVVDVLDWHLARHPDRLHLTVLEDDVTALATMTYRELAEAARAFAQTTTSSGKIRRSAAKELYISGRLDAPQHAVWRQILQVLLAGIGRQLRRLLAVFRETIYATWWWIVVALSFLLAWLAVMLLPRLDWRWSVVRVIAWAARAVLRIPIVIVGLDGVPRGNAMLVFCHSSYMDALALAAVLPGQPAYVAKRELSQQIFAGPFLRRLEALFVERFDVSASLSDAEAVAVTPDIS